MHATYKNVLMWTLYGAFFLLLTVLQTVVSVSYTHLTLPTNSLV